MSLLGNRGRFTSDLKMNIENMKGDVSSVISLIGKNPFSLFTVTKKEDSNDSNKGSNTNSHKKSDVKSYLNKRNSEHSYEDEYDDIYSSKYKPKRGKRKTSIGLIVAMFVIELFALIGVISLGTFIRLSNMTQNVSFNKAAVENKNIDESTLAVMKGYKTVAVFGLDSRTGSIDKGNNSDVNIIVNLNLETGEAQLISLYRDLYLNVNNTYEKLNASYRRGGPEGAVSTINKNFDLNINNFFSFNWKAVADGIELLGGIDVEITKSEFKYINAFVHETCIATGVDAKNPAAHYIKSHGVNHLDGIQAVAYGRLRLMDSDFQRVERQKKVISICLEKAKKLDIAQMKVIMEAILPQIAYEFDMNEMLSLLKIVKTIKISNSSGCPDADNVIAMDMGANGDCIVPLNLEKAVIKLHSILYGDDDYKPSSHVKSISNRIIELRRKYAAENATKSTEEEEIVDIIVTNEEGETVVSKVKRKASKSNATKATNLTDGEEVTLVKPIIYPEEPESDQETKSNVENIDTSESETKKTDNETIETTKKSVGTNEAKIVTSPGDDMKANNSSTSSKSPSSSEEVEGVVISGPPGSSSSSQNSAPTGVVTSDGPSSSSQNSAPTGSVTSNGTSSTNQNEVVVPIISPQ